jgi:hypothetical protein
MAGSNIFVVYGSADGKNVTVSPRTGTGYAQPIFNGDVQIELLQGSGVRGGMMVANLRCGLLGALLQHDS